jgi:hypothetical protein
MKPDEFEKRLSNQPMKRVPTEWRAEILAAAGAEVKREQAVSRELTFGATVALRLRHIFWPSPVAWAGLAGVWVCILALNFSMRERPAVMEARASSSSPPSPEMMAELKQQQRMLAELMGSGEARVADRQRMLAPKPRSEREGIAMV